MKLNELHVDEFCACVVGECVSIAGVFPTVTGDFVSAPDPARRQHDCSSAENFEAPALALVSKSANHTIAIF